MNEKIKSKISLFVLISSLMFYFLLSLPLNLSVVCANENQGFAFTFGQNLLHYHKLAAGRGILFVLLYAVVLKAFGFNTYSIIFVHFIGTLLLLSVGILIYFIVSRILKESLFAALATLLWVLMINTPIGLSRKKMQKMSSLNYTKVATNSWMVY